MVDEQAVIRALTKSAEIDDKPEARRESKPVITISRTIGSGGDEIARALAERLGVECYAKEILDSVVKSSDFTKKLAADLHEKVSQTSDAWLYSLVFGKNVRKDDYLHHLAVTIRQLYQLGGVIVGRGGHLILAGRDVLRVRVTGSVEACARRIALQDGTDLAEAKKKVRQSNKARGQFQWKMFGSRANDPANYDIVINTDHFAEYDHVVKILMQAMKSLGLDKPATGTNRK